MGDASSARRRLRNQRGFGAQPWRGHRLSHNLADRAPADDLRGRRWTVGEMEGSKMLRPFALMATSIVVLGTSAMAQNVQPVAKDAIVFSYKIHYLEAGRGAPVILLHGAGGEGARWMPTI